VADSVADPDKKARWLFGTVVAMLLAGFVGLLPLAAWIYDHRDAISWSGLKEAFTTAAIGTCASFWTIFPIVYFCYIRKSAATLEYQRIVREGEQTRGRPDP